MEPVTGMTKVMMEWPRGRKGARGLLAAVAGLAASELPKAASARFPSLVLATGQRIIRSAPGGVVHRAVATVGAADKPLLVGGVVAAVLLLGAATAPLAVRRPGTADLLTAGVAGLGWASATSLGSGGLRALLPATVGTLSAIAIRRRAMWGEPVTWWSRGPDISAVPLGPTSTRRRFLAAGGIAGGAAAVALGSAAALRRSRTAGTSSALPESAAGRGQPPAGLVLAGLSPLSTPTSAFYRIDEALVVPAVDVAAWRLRVTGLVASPFELSYDELLAGPLVEHDITLCCVSNEVGGRLVSTARWTGVRLVDLLRRAGLDPAATQLVGRSVDGFSVGFPMAAALDGRQALVAVGMNGEPLPPKHGFPARLVVPGLYGFVSATKWLKELEVSTWEAFEPYWPTRGWAREAPVKASSRIDVPKDYSRVAPGRQVIGGVAWAPTAGIASVAIRIDGGSWEPARLGPSLGGDAWRQWVSEWDPAPGTHTIEVRAVTTTGQVQTEEKRSSFPKGASGLHTCHVRVVPVD